MALLTIKAAKKLVKGIYPNAAVSVWGHKEFTVYDRPGGKVIASSPVSYNEAWRQAGLRMVGQTAPYSGN